MKIGQLEIDLKELTSFIVKAKKSSYAGGGEEVILPDGSKLLTFQEGDFHYQDNYAGWYQAPGTEIVRWKNENGQRIWQMSYSGGMSELCFRNKELTKKTFEFLKEVLLQVDFEYPFRGPTIYFNPPYSYFNETRGDIKNFKGRERISLGNNSRDSQKIFTQDYIGGLVIPK